jgi:flagellar M-ring protein FliF
MNVQQLSRLCETLMNQLARIWNALSRSQQVSLILAPILIGAASLALLKWKREANFRVLYSSLAPEDAAAVTGKIKEAGIEYRFDETGATVLVPSERLADARLALAGAGMPKTGRIGFELFDRNNLGASDFAEQVNYRRALEGELEQTVATLSEVAQARIHITFAKESVFLDARQPSKATVVLRLKGSVRLPQASVIAIANLVASAVDGLAPESVAIIDSSGRLLNRPRTSGDGDVQLAEANLDYQRQVESDLLNRINTALEPLLGAERFRASVSVDCDFTTSEQNEEMVDPAKSAVLTSQTTEESSGAGIAGGTPGTASNLPNPPVRAASGASAIIRRTENTSWQPSRTVKRTVTPKGTVRRISTAVLVDHAVRWEGTGPKAKRIAVPPSPELIKGVHDIVAGITGFVEQRGDQIAIEALPFEGGAEFEPPPAVGPPARVQGNGSDFKQPLLIGVVAIVAILAVGATLLSIRKRSALTVADVAPGAIAPGTPANAAAPAAAINRERLMEQQIAENDTQQAQLESEAMSRIKLPGSTRKTEVLVKHIRESVHKDSVNATNVLRTWISDPEPRRSS